MAQPIIGVLALQGAVEPHREHIIAAGAEYRPVKTIDEFKSVDAFILPGGESTVMLKLIDQFELYDELHNQFVNKPVWGICAGSILLASKVTDPAQTSFGILPITIKRNGYGRQADSHHAVIHEYTVSFIRAPIITNIGIGVTVKATHNNDPVWVEMGNKMATTFHPELTQNFPSPMHKQFIAMI
jgi:5'-phosphate synthase pdxT subunit